MSQLLRILHLEDDAADMELVQAMFDSACIACQITRVQTPEEFNDALHKGEYDIILADFRLPMFDGMSALRLVRERNIDVPFIFVSGTMGEDAAIDALTDGATDYVLKHKLSRLVPAVQRALHDVENQRERKRAEEALRHSEKEKTILNQIANIFLTLPDEEMYGEVLAVIMRVMKSKFGVFGFIGDNGDFIVPSLTREIWSECQVSGKSIVFPSATWGESRWGRAIREKKAFYSDGPFHIPEGHIHIDNFLAMPIVFGSETIGLLSVANREQGYAEADKVLLERIAGNISPILNARLQRDRQEQERKQAEERNLRLAAIVESSDDAIIGKTLNGIITSWNKGAEKIYGYQEDEVIGKSISLLVPQGLQDELLQLLEKITRGEPIEHYETVRRRKDGNDIHMSLTVSPIRNRAGEIIGASTIGRDITKSKKVETELREATERLSLKLDSILSPDVDISEQELANIIDSKALQSLMDNFYAVTRMGIAISDLKGNVLVGTGWQDICTKFHRVNPETRKNCIESDLILSRDVQQGEFRFYKCKNNLRDIVTPIFIGGKHVGNVFFGQFFYDDEVPDHEVFAAQAEKYGFAKREYLAALERVPRWSRDSVQHLIEFYAQLARMIAQFSYSNLGQAKALVERKRAEEALRVASVYNRNLIEASLDPLVTIGPDGTITDVNAATEAVTGYTRQQLIGTVFSNYFTEPVKAQAGYEQVFREGKVIDYPLEIKHRDGRLTSVLYNASVYRDEAGQVIGVFAAARDITERKRAEEALGESEERFRSLAESANESIVTIDNHGKIVFFNRAAEAAYGYSTDEALGKVFSLLIPERFREQQWDRVKHEFSFDEQDFVEKLLVGIGLKKDGSEFPIEFSLAKWKIKNNLFITIILRDITERKRAEESLNRLSTAIAQADEVIVVTDTDGTIQYVNPAFEHITGYTPAEAIGQNPRVLNSGKQNGRFYQELWDTISRGMVWRGNFINKKKDGSLFDEEATISPVKNSSGVITNYVAVKRDVTQQLKMEDQLRQAQKMEAIGTLAGGIAHDFNNILAAIMGYTEISLQYALEGSNIKQNLEQILKSSMRARDLVKQILTFSRKSEQEQKPTEIRLIIKEALKLLRASIPATITIRQDISDQSDIVMADPIQIHQLLMNLCTNAAHAMSETGGELAIALSRIVLGVKDVTAYPDLQPGAYLKLMVSDTGKGIAPAIIDRIFEPFFTTKGLGEGTGMGLAVVHGIVKSHRGAITVKSEPGRGTTFHVLLPLIEGAGAKEEETARVMPTGTEHVLLVDDEEVIVDIGQRLLESLGYRVTPARSSAEALELFQKAPAKYDLVITDYTMPHMTGYELAKELIHIRPDTPIILCTGYNEQITDVKVKEIGVRAFLLKPIKLQQMAEAIRKALPDRMPQ